MNLSQELGGRPRVLSENTVVFEYDSKGAQRMTPLEVKMYGLLQRLTKDQA